MPNDSWLAVLPDIFWIFDKKISQIDCDVNALHFYANYFYSNQKLPISKYKFDLL